MCKPCYKAAWSYANRDRFRKPKRRAAALTGMRATARYISMQALSAANVAEHRVTALMHHLGLTAPMLQRDVPSVLILLKELLEPVRYEHVIQPGFIRYWGGVFFGMDETYLEAIGLLTKTEEPWRPFCDYANRLTQMLHTMGSDAMTHSEELFLAAKYLESARQNLWHVAYVLCHLRHGYKVATDVFGDAGKAVNELCALLH
jgi:hypothetical protein